MRVSKTMTLIRLAFLRTVGSAKCHIKEKEKKKFAPRTLEARVNERNESSRLSFFSFALACDSAAFYLAISSMVHLVQTKWTIKKRIKSHR